jgi:hypothetical protein
MAPNPTPAPVASHPPLLQWHPIPHQHLSHLPLLSYNGTQSHTSTCRISPSSLTMTPNPTPAPVASHPPLLQWHPIPHQHLSHLTLLSYNGTQSHTSTCRISPGVRIDSKGGASKPYFGYPFVFDTEMFAGMEGGAIADGEHYAVTYYTLTHYTSHTIRHTLYATHYTSHTIRHTPGQHTPPYAVMISFFVLSVAGSKQKGGGGAGGGTGGGGAGGGGAGGGAVVPSRPAEGHGQKDTQHTQKDTQHTQKDTQQQVLSKFCGHAVVIVPRTIRYSVK